MTPLLAAAAARGAAAVNGLGMLVHQAAHAFRRWTGEAPPIDAMVGRDAARLARRAQVTASVTGLKPWSRAVTGPYPRPVVNSTLGARCARPRLARSAGDAWRASSHRRYSVGAARDTRHVLTAGRPAAPRDDVEDGSAPDRRRPRAGQRVARRGQRRRRRRRPGRRRHAHRRGGLRAAALRLAARSRSTPTTPRPRVASPEDVEALLRRANVAAQRVDRARGRRALARARGHPRRRPVGRRGDDRRRPLALAGGRRLRAHRGRAGHGPRPDRAGRVPGRARPGRAGRGRGRSPRLGARSRDPPAPAGVHPRPDPPLHPARPGPRPAGPVGPVGRPAHRTGEVPRAGWRQTGEMPAIGSERRSTPTGNGHARASPTTPWPRRPRPVRRPSRRPPSRPARAASPSRLGRNRNASPSAPGQRADHRLDPAGHRRHARRSAATARPARPGPRWHRPPAPTTRVGCVPATPRPRNGAADTPPPAQRRRRHRPGRPHRASRPRHPAPLGARGPQRPASPSRPTPGAGVPGPGATTAVRRRPARPVARARTTPARSVPSRPRRCRPTCTGPPTTRAVAPSTAGRARPFSGLSSLGPPRARSRPSRRQRRRDRAARGGHEPRGPRRGAVDRGQRRWLHRSGSAARARTSPSAAGSSASCPPSADRHRSRPASRARAWTAGAPRASCPGERSRMSEAVLVAAMVIVGVAVVGPLLNHAVIRWIGWRVVLPPCLGRVPASRALGRPAPLRALRPAAGPVRPPRPACHGGAAGAAASAERASPAATWRSRWPPARSSASSPR